MKFDKQLFKEHVYENCLTERIKELFNKKINTYEIVLGQRLYINILRIQVKNIRGYRYFLIVIDNIIRK